MSIADNAGGSGTGLRSKRPKRFLTKSEWERVRVHYELDPTKPSYRDISKLYDIPLGTLFKKAMRDKWKQRDRDRVNLITRQDLDNQMSEVIKREAAPVIAELARKSLEDLAPWLEKKKRKHIKSIVGLSERGIKRVSTLMRSSEPTDAKVEAFTSKTADTWDGIMRRSLGLGDTGGLAGGSIALNILNQGALAISMPDKGDSEAR